MADSGYAEAVVALENDVDAACSKAQAVLSNREIADELRRIAQGWEDSA